VTNATDHLAEGLRLDILLSETKNIRFEKFHDVSSVGTVLRNHKSAEQVARIAPKNEEDTAILNALARYMAVNQHVSIPPVAFG
jgi:hypothetical protein